MKVWEAAAVTALVAVVATAGAVRHAAWKIVHECTKGGYPR